MSQRSLVLGLLIGLSGIGWSQRLLILTDWAGRGYYPPIHLSGDGRTVYINNSVVVQGRLVPAISRWREGEGWWYLRADGGLTRNPEEATLIGLVDAVSYDGSVVVGSVLRGQRSRAYRWRLGRGIEYLADPPGAVISTWAQGVSADGTIVAGNVVVWEGTREVWYLARWFADGRVEIIPGSRELAMRALSGDGRVIVGTDFSYYIPIGFRWVEGRGVEHPFLGSPRDLSYDGRIVVGMGRWAFRWVEGRGYEPSRLVPFDHEWSAALSVSWDGRVVGGWYEVERYSGFRGFVWREGSGFADLYEAFRGLWPEWVTEISGAEDLSANGRYLVGMVSTRDRWFYPFWLDMGRLGDVDGDGCVDDRDLLEVLFDFGLSGMNLRGDLDGDGVVGESDLLEVLEHFGEGC